MNMSLFYTVLQTKQDLHTCTAQPQEVGFGLLFYLSSVWRELMFDQCYWVIAAYNNHWKVLKVVHNVWLTKSNRINLDLYQMVQLFSRCLECSSKTRPTLNVHKALCWVWWKLHGRWISMMSDWPWSVWFNTQSW